MPVTTAKAFLGPGDEPDPAGEPLFAAHNSRPVFDPRWRETRTPTFHGLMSTGSASFAMVMADGMRREGHLVAVSHRVSVQELHHDPRRRECRFVQGHGATGSGSSAPVPSPTPRSRAVR